MCSLRLGLCDVSSLKMFEVVQFTTFRYMYLTSHAICGFGGRQLLLETFIVVRQLDLPQLPACTKLMMADKPVKISSQGLSASVESVRSKASSEL